MFSRIALVTLLATSSMLMSGCAEADPETEESSQDELTAATFTEADDSRARYLDGPRAIRVKLSADEETEWVVRSDGGLGKPKIRIREDSYTFSWPKRVVENERTYTLSFTKRDKASGDEVGRVVLTVVVGQGLNAPKKAADHYVNANHEGSTVVIASGDNVVLSLERPRETEWHVVSLPDSWTKPEQKNEYNILPGGRVLQRFTWNAVAAEGVHLLELEERQIGNEVLKGTFTVTVDVRPRED